MATIMKCDRCNSEKKVGEVVVVSVPVIAQYNRVSLADLNEKNYDLCADCLVKLNEFLKPQPVVKAG